MSESLAPLFEERDEDDSSRPWWVTVVGIIVALVIAWAVFGLAY